MKIFSVRSPAKINICLNVTGKQDDGYHQLDMVMLPLLMHDSILFADLKNASDNFVTVDDFYMGPTSYNLVTSAIEKLCVYKKFKNKFRISIHKVIPMQSGLGGGSSNAASTLTALNKYLKLGLSTEELIKIGVSLGADIPFFVAGKPARCRGIGEKLDFINIKNDYYVLVVKPSQGCSTKGVYKISDQMDLPVGNVEDVIKALEEGDDDLLAASIFNALEEPAMSLVPEIKIIKQKLLDAGLKIVQMSGSGSAVFAMSTDKKILKTAMRQLEDDYLVELTKVMK